MKIFNSVGCTINGISEEEFPKFEKVGWMTEDKYFELNPEEKNDK